MEETPKQVEKHEPDFAVDDEGLKALREIFGDLFSKEPTPIPEHQGGWGDPDVLEDLFTKEVIPHLLTRCGTIAVCDYGTFLGDSLKEKFESLYIKLHEVSNVVAAKSGLHPHWILAGTFVGNLIGCFSSSYGHNEKPKVTNYVKRLNNKWDVFRTEQLEPGMVIMGTNEALRNPFEESKYLARLTVCNTPKSI